MTWVARDRAQTATQAPSSQAGRQGWQQGRRRTPLIRTPGDPSIHQVHQVIPLFFTFPTLVSPLSPALMHPLYKFIVQMWILLLPLNSVNVFPIFWQLKLQKLDPIALSSLHFSLQHSQHCCHSFPCKFMIDWDNWQWRCIFTCQHSSCIVTPTLDIAKCQLLKMRWETHTLSSSQSCDRYDLDISGPSSTDSTPSLRRRATQTTESRCEPRFEIFQSINWRAYSTRWRDLWRWELHSSGLSADLWPVYVPSELWPVCPVNQLPTDFQQLPEPLWWVFGPHKVNVRWTKQLLCDHNDGQTRSQTRPLPKEFLNWRRTDKRHARYMRQLQFSRDV